MKKLLSMVLVIVMLSAFCAAFAEAAPTVYKVEDQNGNVIYLFGTLHAVKADAYANAEPFGPAIEEAYAYADILAVEIDLLAALDSSASEQTASLDMFYTDGTTVLDHGISEETLNELAQILGLPASSLALVKLNNWPSLLILPALAELNMDMENGVDMWLLQRAYEDGKQVVELETMESQLDVFDMSDELVLEQIESLLEDPTQGIAELAEMYNAWLAGDNETLKALFNEAESTEGLSDGLAAEMNDFNTALTAERDDDFLNDAIGYLERGEKVLIAIGTAHIIGETGIAQRLAEAGYTVTDISR